MFSQVSVCPQSASWILDHCSALLRHGRYASHWNAFLLLVKIEWEISTIPLNGVAYEDLPKSPYFDSSTPCVLFASVHVSKTHQARVKEVSMRHVIKFWVPFAILLLQRSLAAMLKSYEELHLHLFRAGPSVVIGVWPFCTDSTEELLIVTWRSIHCVCVCSDLCHAILENANV